MIPWAMTEFRAMSASCRIVAPDLDLAHEGEQLIHELERRWSRFLPDSEISALNALDGRLGIVSPETFELVACAERARETTAGAFNPLMLNQVEAVGYDTTWPTVADSEAPLPNAVYGCTEPIDLFPEVCGIRLPAGTRFDPGGIGKGLAGDMAATRLRELGATTVQIELGGDVRLDGPEWSGDEWTVVVEDRDHGVDHAASIRIPEGGVATSSSVRRSWRRGPHRMHHLLNPTTGLPADTDLAAATVVAPTLWWAEVVAKVVVIAGHASGRRFIEQHGMTGVLVTHQPSYDVVTPRDPRAATQPSDAEHTEVAA